MNGCDWPHFCYKSSFLEVEVCSQELVFASIYIMFGVLFGWLLWGHR